MGLYQRYIEPRLVNLACGAKPIRYQRRKVVPQAEGRVLEVGIGSGHNLPYYDADRVEEVIGLDPSEEMLALGEVRLRASPVPVELVRLEEERIPLDDGTVDTVLVTYTLCSIPDALTALTDMRRVLKRGGRLIFCEHGAAPDATVRRWQDRLNPVWGKLFGGCNLNRDIPALISGSGFRVEGLETMYLPSTPRFAGYNYWGTARPG